MPIKQIIGIPGVPGAVGVWDDDPDAIAAHVALTSGPHDLGVTWFSKYIIRGIARSGIPTGQACWFAEDFSDISRWQKTAGVASLAAVTTLAGGVAQIGAGVGDAVEYHNGDAILGIPTICKGDGLLYVAARMRLAVAPPADGVALVGLSSAGFDQILLGYVGAVDAVHFIGGTVNGGVSAAASTIAVDTSWHDLEIWYAGVGANYYFSVDGETPVIFASAPQPTDYVGAYLATNGGAGAETTAQFDKYLCVFPQAA